MFSNTLLQLLASIFDREMRVSQPVVSKQKVVTLLSDRNAFNPRDGLEDQWNTSAVAFHYHWPVNLALAALAF